MTSFSMPPREAIEPSPRTVVEPPPPPSPVLTVEAAPPHEAVEPPAAAEPPAVATTTDAGVALAITTRPARSTAWQGPPAGEAH